MQGNGDTETAENSTVVNGYTCRDCSMLSKRKEVLTAYSPSHVPSSRIYSRDRSQKHASSKLLSLFFFSFGWQNGVQFSSCFFHVVFFKYSSCPAKFINIQILDISLQGIPSSVSFETLRTCWLLISNHQLFFFSATVGLTRFSNTCLFLRFW